MGNLYYTMKNIYPCLFFFLFFSFSSFAQQNFKLTADAQRFSTQVDQENQKIHLCGLKLGQLYEVSAQADGDACKILLTNQLTTNSTIQFVANAACQTLTVKKQCSNIVDAYISVANLTPTLTSTDHPEANLDVAVGVSADELIQGVLIGNNCSIDLNVEQHGENIQFGTFSNGAASIGFDEGIIISTGHINNAIGPNNSGSQGTNVPNNNTDSDLTAVVAQSTYDAAVIEFDFTPVSNQIEFEYVFASEEYCEFVNKDYNDVFGFFISGPGIVGTQNIARVPTTGEVVSIDNINHLKNSAFFNPNSSSCGGTTNAADIQFDGFTTPLTATATVIPCETYHIKLAIADVGDGIYDSAVFLRAGSFNAGDIVQVTPKSNILATQNSIEGCDNGYLVFDRSCSNDINQPLTLSIQVLPTSTATAGIDYVALPTSFTIPAGVTSDSIPVFAIDDGLAEGNETINIEVTGQYPCYKPTATITISDKMTIQATGVDTSLCANILTTLQPTIQGGFSPFSYLWSNGDTTSMLSQKFASSELVSCVITDVCNNQSQADFAIEVIPASTGEISGDGTLCDNTSTATISLAFTGVPPWNVTIEKDGAVHFTKQYNTPNSSFSVNQAGHYKIQSISSYGCMGTTAGLAKIKNTTLNTAISQTDVSCFGLKDGTIIATPMTGAPPYQFNWSTTTLDTLPTITQLPAGNYTVTVTDNDGCTTEESAQITEPDELIFSVSDVQHVNCFSPQGGSIHTQTEGGTSPFKYSWSNGAITPNIDNLADGLITGLVIDGHGCQDSLEMLIVGDFEKPTVTITPSDTINCYQSEINLSGLGTSIGANFSYHWTTTDGQIILGDSTLSPLINQPGTYSLTTSNIINGCTASASILVPIDTTPPSADAGQTFALNCTDTTTIIGTPDQVSPHEYLWSSLDGHFLGNIAKSQTIVDAPGIYNLLVINTLNGCSDTDSVEITEISTRPNQAMLSTIDPTCLEYDGSISVYDIRGGTPPYLISYDGGQTFYDTTTNNTLNHGEYDIIIQDIYGCEYHKKATLYAPTKPSLNVVPNYIIELGDSIQLETHSSVFAVDLDSVIWAPIPDTNCVNCLTPFAKPLITTEYNITIIDDQHCEASAKIMVMVQDPDVYIPNVFSPQGAVQGNWSFTIFGNTKRIKSINQLQIYDRWGNQVFFKKDFAPNNMSLGWNGQYRHQNAPAGVYIYDAEIEFINGKKKRYSGDVTLVR